MERDIHTEKRLATMEQKIDDLREDVKEIASDIKDHIKLEAEKYEKLDSRYSGKWVETGVVSIITALVIASIIGLSTYFFKN